MMAVEDGKTSVAGTPNSFPTSLQTCSQALMPARPVAQLAFREFTRRARTRPPLESSDARPTSTGAATTRFFVNNAAAVPPPGTAELRSAWTLRLRSGRARADTRPQTSTRARSGRPLTLMPAATAEKANPRGRRIFSGERRSEVMRESSTNFWAAARLQTWARLDRKSTRLNSSHQIISYAVFCLKKKKTTDTHY